MIRTTKSLLFLGLLAAGQTSCGEAKDCPYIYGQSITALKFKTDYTTPNGVSVDNSGFDVDLQAVDCVIDAADECLRDIGVLNRSVDRTCLQVLVAPDSHENPCVAGHQVFSCDLSYYPECRPGVERECPCACAGVVQDGDIMVTTPDLAALAHEYTHVATGLFDPFSKEVSYCADGVRPANCATFNSASVGQASSALTAAGCRSLVPLDEHPTTRRQCGR